MLCAVLSLCSAGGRASTCSIPESFRNADRVPDTWNVGEVRNVVPFWSVHIPSMNECTYIGVYI